MANRRRAIEGRMTGTALPPNNRYATDKLERWPGVNAPPRADASAQIVAYRQLAQGRPYFTARATAIPTSGMRSTEDTFQPCAEYCGSQKECSSGNGSSSPRSESGSPG